MQLSFMKDQIDVTSISKKQGEVMHQIFHERLSSCIGRSDRDILCEETQGEGSMYVAITLRGIRQLEVLLGLL